MYCLMYVSLVANLCSPAQVNEILEVSKRNNPKLEVTGVLIFYSGVFLQVLEGPEHSVKKLFGKISMDKRHYLIKTIQEGPVAKRSFPDWSMAFSNKGNFKDGWVDKVLEMANQKGDYFSKISDLLKYI